MSQEERRAHLRRSALLVLSYLAALGLVAGAYA